MRAIECYFASRTKKGGEMPARALEQKAQEQEAVLLVDGEQFVANYHSERNAEACARSRSGNHTVKPFKVKIISHDPDTGLVPDSGWKRKSGFSVWESIF